MISVLQDENFIDVIVILGSGSVLCFGLFDVAACSSKVLSTVDVSSPPRPTCFSANANGIDS